MTRRQAEALNKEKAAKLVAEVDPAFSIVGIGASAGGLEALESFFRHVPDKSGIAFVVVQEFGPPRFERVRFAGQNIGAGFCHRALPPAS